MTTNILLTILAPAAVKALSAVQASLESLVATPTIENLQAQAATLAIDALAPTSVESIASGTAQEALNGVNALLAHLNALTVAPTAVPMLVTTPPAA